MVRKKSIERHPARLDLEWNSKNVHLEGHPRAGSSEETKEQSSSYFPWCNEGLCQTAA